MFSNVNAVASRASAFRLTSSESRGVAIVWTGYLFVGLGSALRIREYVANRSLTLDESFLALNLVVKSPQQLLETLAFNQAAPLGFLEAEKAAVTLFGRSEYALRLLPLVASLLALVLFYRVAQAVLRPVAATVAVAVFALLDPLVFYAATAKQYALDVACAVFILAIALVVERRSLRTADYVTLGALGSILVWFSHAAAFGLAALGALLIADALRTRMWAPALATLAVVAAWIASFGTQYTLSRRGLTGILGAFQQAGGEAFAPAGDGPDWFLDWLDHVRYVAGLEDASSGEPLLASFGAFAARGMTLLVVSLGVVGFVTLARKSVRLAFMLALPPALAGAAATLGQYPLVSRTLVFAIPSVAICLGGAIEALAEASRRRLQALGVIVTITCLAAIAIIPASYAVRPRPSQEMKAALRYLGTHSAPGDTLYVSSGAQYGLAYYHLCDCAPFDPATRWPFSTRIDRRGTALPVQSHSPDLLIESDSPQDDRQRLLGRGRTWVLVADAWPEDRTSLLEDFETHGKLLRRFETRGPLPSTASLYLFDFAPPR